MDDIITRLNDAFCHGLELLNYIRGCVTCLNLRFGKKKHGQDEQDFAIPDRVKCGILLIPQLYTKLCQIF